MIENGGGSLCTSVHDLLQLHVLSALHVCVCIGECGKHCYLLYVYAYVCVGEGGKRCSAIHVRIFTVLCVCTCIWQM
jgi:hypothetical protein